MESHLLQMRGLKLSSFRMNLLYLKSHLLQMRGLKPYFFIIKNLISVASFTDAWIETKIEKPVEQLNIVASFTDAWIETKQSDQP